MADDIIARLRCSYADPPCEQCAFCAARAEIERLRAREQDLRMHAEQDACEIERLRSEVESQTFWAELLAGNNCWCVADDVGVCAPCAYRQTMRQNEEARRG